MPSGERGQDVRVRRERDHLGREELDELEGTDVEERAAAEADVGDVGVVLAELAELVALAA